MERKFSIKCPHCNEAIIREDDLDYLGIEKCDHCSKELECEFYEDEHGDYFVWLEKRSNE